MKTASPLLIVLFGAAASHASAAESCTRPLSAEVQDRSSFTKERAIVEDVVSTDRDGYRSRGYIVTWHGARVLVSDVLAQGNKSAGDTIDFIASRHEAGGNRILNFTSSEQGPHRTAPVPGSSILESSATTATGLVEEVLSAEDNGFRFTAYVVRSQDQRFAVSDPLALSHHAIGEQIGYLMMKTASPTGPLLGLQVQMSGDERASIAKPLCEVPPSRETGIVNQALFTDADGYKYRAYVIEWHGSKVVIDDPTAATTYQPGDSVTFWVSRHEVPPPNSQKHQWFAFNRPPEPSVVNQPADLRASVVMDSAPVEAVLASDLDGYRSVAYLVNWHNTPVAIIDAFATTHFGVGDRITFSVARASDPNMKALSFMLFAFPTHPCSKPQLSSGDSTTAAPAKAQVGGCHS